MKKSIIVVVMGLCYAFCMAQPLDKTRIEANWDNIIAYCCAQYELDYLQSSNPTANGDVIAKLKGVNLGNNGFNMAYVHVVNQEIQDEAVIKGFEHYFDSLSSVSNKTQSWNALFVELKSDQYSSQRQAERLSKNLNSVYAYQPSAKGKSTWMCLWDSISLVELILIVLIVALLVCVIISFAKISSYRANLADIKDRVRHLERSYSNSNKAPSKEYSHKSSLDAGAILDLASRVSRLESVVTSLKAKNVSEKSVLNNEIVNELSDNGTKEINRNLEVQKQSFFSVFLKNFNEGVMKECVVEEAQYELLLPDKQSSTGDFMFVGNIEAALATKDATFDYVCDLENWSLSAKSCTTTENGKAEKMSDGKWRVVRKGKVKFS